VKKNIVLGLSFLLASSAISGCATTRTPGSSGADSTAYPYSPSRGLNPEEALAQNGEGGFGPNAPSESPSPAYGPEPDVLRPIVLVFGPGLARSFSYVGVIRALHERKIPIGAVLGTEMGGVIAALYAMSPNLNQFEWGLMHFKEDVFQKKSGFLSSLGSSEGRQMSPEKLENALAEVFGKRDLSEARIPLRIAAQSTATSIPIFFAKGPAAGILRGVIASPRLFSPFTITEEDQPVEIASASSIKPFLVQEAKSLQMGPVIVVSVLSESESAIAWDELKMADLILKPKMGGIGYFDFKKRNEAAFRGKSEVTKHIDAITALAQPR